MLLWSLLGVLIVILDQVVKCLVVNHIDLTETIRVIPNVLDFVYVKNTGAAFSFMADKTYGIVILSLISILFCIGVVWYLFKKRPENKLMILSLVLMFSGALGNAIDRIFRRFVVDFIEVTFINFPVFNIADIAITVGAGLLIVYILFFDKSVKE